jgi:lysophospholipase L1-like esterase
MNLGSVALIIGGLTLLALEGGLRLFFGFGTPPLYVADPAIGYLLAPNQRLRRFGNRIEINQYAMRSGPIQPERPATRLRLLMLGDSIVNGGWWTDQSRTLSALLEQGLKGALPADYDSVEVLNASANSWGPRNEAAYLERFGVFGAQVVLLVLNTDDLFSTQPTPLPVGCDRNYPDRKPVGAIAEVFHRYVKKPVPIPGLKAIQSEPGDRVGRNLEALHQIQQQVTAANGQLILAMTPLKREVLPPGPRDYERRARQRLNAWADSAQLPYLDFLTLFQQAEHPESLYRDHIHLSPTGNALVSNTLQQAVRERLGVR